MDDIKIIIWIIIGIIYLFSRGKKKEVPPPRRQRPVEPEETAEPSGPAPKSFEELLREIQGMKEPAASKREIPKAEPEYVDYDDSVREEKEDLEEVVTDYRKQDNIYQVYEDARAQAFERPSLEETVKLEDTIVRFKQFKGYEKSTRANLASEVLKDFKDPQGFRKAFIMSEILRTKF